MYTRHFRLTIRNWRAKRYWKMENFKFQNKRDNLCKIGKYLLLYPCDTMAWFIVSIDISNLSMFRDIASIVSEKVVNPENNRPYTVNTKFRRNYHIVTSLIWSDIYDSKCDETDPLFCSYIKKCKAAGSCTMYSSILQIFRCVSYIYLILLFAIPKALDVIRKLKAVMPIARALMLLRVICLKPRKCEVFT